MVGIQDAEGAGAKNTRPTTHLRLLVIEDVPVESEAGRNNDVTGDIGGAAAGKVGGKHRIEERIVRINVGVDAHAASQHQVRTNLPFILKVAAEIE